MSLLTLVASPIVFLFNLLTLIASAKAKFTMKAYKKFLMSLLTSNLCICFVNTLMSSLELAAENKNISDKSYKCFAGIGRSFEIVALVGHLLNLCAMSVDHFIGIVSCFFF